MGRLVGEVGQEEVDGSVRRVENGVRNPPNTENSE